MSPALNHRWVAQGLPGAAEARPGEGSLMTTSPPPVPLAWLCSRYSKLTSSSSLLLSSHIKSPYIPSSLPSSNIPLPRKRPSSLPTKMQHICKNAGAGRKVKDPLTSPRDLSTALLENGSEFYLLSPSGRLGTLFLVGRHFHFRRVSGRWASSLNDRILFYQMSRK